jgi:hypothetical protein
MCRTACGKAVLPPFGSAPSTPERGFQQLADSSMHSCLLMSETQKQSPVQAEFQHGTDHRDVISLNNTDEVFHTFHCLSSKRNLNG